MAASTAFSGIKFDDGKGGYATNCFPVRGLSKQSEDDGAWLVAHAAEQRRRFKAVLCTKPLRTFSQIRQERNRAEKTGSNFVPPNADESDEEDDKPLDGFFLMKHCCVEDPSDLCSVNISCQGLTEAKVEDFALFDNVAYVNASENILPLDAFKHFPIIRELELPLNAVRNITLHNEDFPRLEMLDLSYNNLSSDDMLRLGMLPNLRVLHLSGNNIKTIPADLSLPPKEDTSSIEGEKTPQGRYNQLEILLLDDNQISDVSAFASLAGLRRLRHLNLSKNQIYSIPQLMLVEGRHVPTVLSSTSARSRRKASARRTPRSGRKSRKPTASSPEKAKTNSYLKTPIQATNFEVKESLSSLNLLDLNLDELDEKIDRVVQETKQFVPSLSQDSLTRNDAKEIVEEIEDVELPAAKEDTFEMPEVETSRYNMPPFPELVHINLSHNKIKDEEGLLAVAAWPMLSELVIHDNPLTTENTGDPPLLRQFLQERLGIRIQRKKAVPMAKPPVEIHAKPERMVNTHVPKVPKQDVDAIIAAIEAPLRRPALPSSSTSPSTTPPPQTLERHTPLPPIPSTPKDEQNEPVKEEYGGDAFFMTQLEEMEIDPKSQTAVLKKTSEHKQKKRDNRTSKLTKEERKKYKGYEELLDIEDDLDDEELPNPNDLQGNVRALKYTIEHPLVFRDPHVRLDQEQKPYQPHSKKTIKRAIVKTKPERTTNLLQDMRNRQTVLEEELAVVLNEKQKYKEDFKNAGQLLGEVQNRYNAVRTSSMNHADGMSKKAKAILRDTLHETQNTNGQ